MKNCLQNVFFSKLIATSLIVSLVATKANAAIDFFKGDASAAPYLGVSGGYSKYPDYKPKPNGGKLAPIGVDVIKPGYAIKLLAGYKFNEYVRLEGEITYRKHVFDKFKLIRDFPPKNFKAGQVVKLGKSFGYAASISTMINFYVDYANDSSFTPFVGVGGGLVFFKENNTCGKPKSTKPAFQITPGVSYKLNEQLSIDLSYRYFQMKDTNITNNCLSPKIKYNTHEGLLGLKLFF